MGEHADESVDRMEEWIDRHSRSGDCGQYVDRLRERGLDARQIHAVLLTMDELRGHLAEVFQKYIYEQDSDIDSEDEP